MPCAPFAVTPCSSSRPVSTTEGATITTEAGDDVDIEVSNDVNEGVILEVCAAAPIAPVKVGDDAGDDVDIPTKALEIDGAAIAASGVSQEGDCPPAVADSICEIIGMLCGNLGPLAPPAIADSFCGTVGVVGAICD